MGIILTGLEHPARLQVLVLDQVRTILMEQAKVPISSETNMNNSKQILSIDFITSSFLNGHL